MKVVILAGGYGTRLSEETVFRPKPIVEIGGKPILWHIMKIYSYYGYNEFIICLGYKGYMIKEYFYNYYLHESDVTFDLSDNSKCTIHATVAEPWKVTLVDTGLDTMTGGRIKRIRDYLDGQTFMMTYGDGVGNIAIDELIEFHKKNGKLSTVTAVRPEGRFGAISIDNDNSVQSFYEKPKGDGGWINGGFFVLEPEVLNYIKNDATLWEKEPMENLAKDEQMDAFKHFGFWKPIDTLRDKVKLEELWEKSEAPWKVWKDMQ